MAKQTPARRGRPPKARPPRLKRVPQTPRAADALDAIVIAAERVLERHGISGLTTNRIAEVAGVSIGTLYQYFPNREAIVAALYERYIAQYAPILPSVLTDQESTPLDVLVDQLVAATLDVYERQPPIHRHLYQLRTSSEMHGPISKHLDAITAFVAGFLERRGFPSGEETHARAFVLVRAFEGVAMGLAELPDGLAPRAVGRAIATMINAYMTASRDE